MFHPTEGVLRRLLDEPAGVADADREHVAGCQKCAGRLAAVRDDAAAVGAALHADDGGDIDAAWQRLSTTAPATGTTRSAAPRPARLRNALRRPIVAGLAATVVLAGAGTAAAANWLPIFHTEKVAPVTFSTDDLVALPDLSAYGDVAVTGDDGLHAVPDAATAAKETGLAIPEVTTLPKGVTGSPQIRVGGKVSATFTFSAERAAKAAASTGQPLPPVPPGLDGSSVRLEAGPGVAQAWSSGSGVPALVVGRAVAPTAFSSGVPFETVRDYVLSLPGLPGNVAAQLRTFEADGSTLPLPVPADYVTSAASDVNGAPATVLTSRDGTMAAVVWVRDGVVTAVAGSLDDDEVLSIARELR